MAREEEEMEGGGRGEERRSRWRKREWEVAGEEEER